MRMPWADPAPIFTIPGGSCSLAVAHQLLISESVLLTGEICPAGMEARAQELLPVPIPSLQPRVFREPSPKLTAFKAVAKRLLFSHLFSNAPKPAMPSSGTARVVEDQRLPAMLAFTSTSHSSELGEPTWIGHLHSPLEATVPLQSCFALCTVWGVKVPVRLSSLQSWAPCALGLP